MININELDNYINKHGLIYHIGSPYLYNPNNNNLLHIRDIIYKIESNKKYVNWWEIIITFLKTRIEIKR